VLRRLELTSNIMGKSSKTYWEKVDYTHTGKQDMSNEQDARIPAGDFS